MVWSDVNKKENVKVVFIVDESGSMKGNRLKIIQGINENIQDMRKDENPVNYDITLVKFSYNVRTVFSKPLSETSDLTLEDYNPSGSTALLDAVGDTISSFPVDQKNVMLFILTDGEENASNRYSKDVIKGLITLRQSINKWAIMFLGANLEAWNQRESLGINTRNTMNFNGNYDVAFESSNYSRGLYTTSVCHGSADNSDLLKGFKGDKSGNTENKT